MRPVLAALFAAIFVPAATAVADPQPHQPRKVVIVIEENKAYGDVLADHPETVDPSTTPAPYLNWLAAHGANFINSHGLRHPSQPNYLDLFAGADYRLKGDECKDALPGQSVGAQLVDSATAGTLPFGGFEGFAEDLGEPQCTTAVYGRKHCPWVHYLDGKGKPLPSADFTDFAKGDFANLPEVSIVIPNLNDDMHNPTQHNKIPIAVHNGDQWLRAHIGPYADWAAHNNSLLIVTFDEDSGDDKNIHQTLNRIPTIFYGEDVLPSRPSVEINHFNILRTIEWLFALPRLDNSSPALNTSWNTEPIAGSTASDAQPITDVIWKPTP